MSVQLGAWIPSILSHRISSHLDAVGIVNQPVDDANGQRGIADLFVPTRDRQLRGQDPRSVQDWEQGRRKPESAARAYLLVIAPSRRR